MCNNHSGGFIRPKSPKWFNLLPRLTAPELYATRAHLQQAIDSPTGGNATVQVRFAVQLTVGGVFSAVEIYNLLLAARVVAGFNLEARSVFYTRQL